MSDGIQTRNIIFKEIHAVFDGPLNDCIHREEFSQIKSSSRKICFQVFVPNQENEKKSQENLFLGLFETKSVFDMRHFVSQFVGVGREKLKEKLKLELEFEFFIVHKEANFELWDQRIRVFLIYFSFLKRAIHTLKYKVSMRE